MDEPVADREGQRPLPVPPASWPSITRDVLQRHAFALSMLAAFVLVLFLPPLLKNEVFTFRDHHDYFQPLRYYSAAYLKTWNLPYWNPYSASGEPWLANPQVGAFYPPTWLYIFLSFERAYALYLALHLFILGVGAYLLFSRRASQGAALAGATALTFSGPVLSLLDVQNNLATFAWVPLVLWCALERRPRAAAVVLALAFLGGEPFFAALAALMYVAVVRDWKQIAIAGAGACGLSAIQLLPFLESLRGSDRAARLTADHILTNSMAPADWLRIAVPPSNGATGFDPDLSQHFIPLVYVGMVTVLLALLAFVPRRSGPAAGETPRRWPWLILLAAAVVVSAGGHIPFAGDSIARMPLTLFRYPARVVPFGALAIAALAVMGWSRVRPARRWVDLVVVLIVLVDLVPRARPLLKTAPFVPGRTAYSTEIGRTAKILRLENRAIVDREAWIAGYANLYHRRFDTSTASPVMDKAYRRLLETAITKRELALLNLMSVGFVLAERPIPPLQPFQTLRGVTAMINPYARPLAEYLPRAKSFGSDEAALAATIDRSVRDAVPVSGPVPPPYDGGGQATVGFVAVDARHARVVVEAPGQGVVVLTQQDAPGWRVTVNGERRNKIKAYGLFLAVAVSPGRNDVEWRYTPRSLHAGTAMTFITALSLQLSRFVKHRKQRKFSS